MAAKRPIIVETSFILSPYWFGIIQDEDDPLVEAVDYAFSRMLAELQGMVMSSEEFEELPFKGTISLRVGKFSAKDKRLIQAAHPTSALIQQYIPLRFKSVWADTDLIRDYNDAVGIRTDRMVLARTCANVVESIGSKLLVLMSCYLPGSLSLSL
jgi:hypothetical protein